MVHASFADVLRTAVKCATLLGVIYMLCMPHTAAGTLVFHKIKNVKKEQ